MNPKISSLLLTLILLNSVMVINSYSFWSSKTTTTSTTTESPDLDPNENDYEENQYDDDNVEERPIQTESPASAESQETTTTKDPIELCFMIKKTVNFQQNCYYCCEPPKQSTTCYCDIVPSAYCRTKTYRRRKTLPKLGCTWNIQASVVTDMQPSNNPNMNYQTPMDMNYQSPMDMNFQSPMGMNYQSPIDMNLFQYPQLQQSQMNFQTSAFQNLQPQSHMNYDGQMNLYQSLQQQPFMNYQAPMNLHQPLQHQPLQNHYNNYFG